LNDLSTQPQESLEKTQNGEGCFLLGLWVTSLVVTIAGSLAYLVIDWFVEQTVFEGSLGITDFRPYIAAVGAFAAVLLYAVLFLIGRSSRYKDYYKSALFAAVLGLVMLPARFLFVTNWQGTISIEIAALLLWLPFAAGGLASLGKSLRRFSVNGLAGVALVIGAIIWLPWATWGALGSLLDTILGLALSALLAWGAVLLTGSFLDGSAPFSRGANVINVMVIWLMLTTAAVPVGMQPFLVPVAILSALLAVGLTRRTQPAGYAPAWWILFAGLAAVLVWLDGDELMLVIASSSGDLFTYAFRMLGITLSLLLFVGSFSLALKDDFFKTLKMGLAGKIAPLIAWLVVVLVYFTLGQPGFYGEKLFVILKDQIDYAQAGLSTDAAAKRGQVYDQATQLAQSSQAGIVSTLEKFHIGYTQFYLENALEVDGGPVVRAWLESQPEVDRVLDSPQLRPIHGAPGVSQGTASKPDSTPWDLTMIGADQVWDQLNVRGAGIVVGQSDSGADGSHVELADSYLGQTGDNNYTWLDPWFGTTTPTDWGGHGTHTLGSIVGDNVGVAPDAEWIGCVNLGRNLGNPARYLTCMQFMLAPYPQNGSALSDGDPARGANVLNNSWGCPKTEGCDPDTFTPALAALKAAGVFVVASAGNSGYGGCGTVQDPIALNADAMSVGSVTNTRDLSDFSSLGPVLVDGSGRLKPEVLAPGDGIVSSFPGGTYEMASGTSMAGPHLVGVVALMWSANPALIGNVDATRQILIDTADAYTGEIPACAQESSDPQLSIGYGMVNAYQAVLAAQDWQP
jgi:subtilisin family serine protease